MNHVNYFQVLLYEKKNSVEDSTDIRNLNRMGIEGYMNDKLEHKNIASFRRKKKRFAIS